MRGPTLAETGWREAGREVSGDRNGREMAEHAAMQRAYVHAYVSSLLGALASLPHSQASAFSLRAHRAQD